MGSFFSSLFAKIASFLTGTAIIISGGSTTPPKPTPTPTIAPPVMTQTVKPSALATTTSTTTKKAEPKKPVAKAPVTKAAAKKVLSPVVSTEAPPVTPAPPIEPVRVPPPNASELNLKTRDSVVNILCTTKSGGSLDPISGSGVIIDDRGVIMTNAHIGQYLLLKNFKNIPDFIDCIARTGSPASPAYTIDLLYISSEWIEANGSKIKQGRPEGTGENDYALLRITGSVRQDAPLPPTFAASTPDTSFNLATIENPVLLVSYPAELLGGILIQRSLNQVSSVSTIKHAYFFRDGDENLLDLFSMGGNIVAQAGSSGGAVVNSEDGKLIGIIVTSTVGATTDNKDLKAISLAHINRSIKRETGKGLAEYLTGDLVAKTAEFQNGQFIRLKGVLEKQISK